MFIAFSRRSTDGKTNVKNAILIGPPTESENIWADVPVRQRPGRSCRNFANKSIRYVDWHGIPTLLKTNHSGKRWAVGFFTGIKKKNRITPPETRVPVHVHGSKSSACRHNARTHIGSCNACNVFRVI